MPSVAYVYMREVYQFRELTVRWDSAIGPKLGLVYIGVHCTLEPLYSRHAPLGQLKVS